MDVETYEQEYVGKDVQLYLTFDGDTWVVWVFDAETPRGDDAEVLDSFMGTRDEVVDYFLNLVENDLKTSSGMVDTRQLT